MKISFRKTFRENNLKRRRLCQNSIQTIDDVDCNFFENVTLTAIDLFSTITNDFEDDGHQSPYSLLTTILISTVIVICMVLTICGNILVLLAFIVDRNIRQPSNYFIASLAATDILIGFSYM